MTDTGSTGSASIETRADVGVEPEGDVKYWLMQLKLVENEDRTWVRKGRDIVKRYRAETSLTTTLKIDRYNILWANTETLKPWLYDRVPQPYVERRYKDKDPVGLLASQILERALSYEDDADDFDAVMRSCVEDRLLPGRAVARVRYKPYFGESTPTAPEPDDAGDDETAELAEDGAPDVGGAGDEAMQGAAVAQPEPVQTVDWECAEVEYVFWEDFRCAPARRWTEVNWVAFRSYLTRDELMARFGREIGRAVKLDYTPKGAGENNKGVPADSYKKAVVWEIWDKTRRQVVWIATGYTDKPLDTKADPLKLTNFFPCPCPLVSTTTNDRMQPVPDFVEYQDQAAELDMLTARLGKLMEALQVKGIYPGSMKATISQLLDPDTENKIIAVDDWPAWADKGGLKNMIEWLPIDQIAGVMVQSFQAREQVKQVIYEITGLADILRASTAPQETATAQELKSNFATMRLKRPQQEVARFARDLVRLRGEVIARHFAERTLSLMTNLPEAMPTPPPQPEPPIPPGGNMLAMDPNAMQAYQQEMQAWLGGKAKWEAEAAKREKEFMAACALMREDAGRGFRIDIETDSTIASDDQRDKQLAIEFVTSVSAFLEKAVPAAQQNPDMAPLLGELLMYAIRHFRAGRTMEGKFQEAVDKLIASAEQAKGAAAQGPHDPKAQAAQAEAQAQVGKNQVAAQKVQTEAAVETRQQDLDAANDQADRELEREKVQAQTTIAGARELNAETRVARTVQ